MYKTIGMLFGIVNLETVCAYAGLYTCTVVTCNWRIGKRIFVFLSEYYLRICNPCSYPISKIKMSVKSFKWHHICIDMNRVDINYPLLWQNYRLHLKSTKHVPWYWLCKIHSRIKIRTNSVCQTTLPQRYWGLIACCSPGENKLAILKLIQ